MVRVKAKSRAERYVLRRMLILFGIITVAYLGFAWWHLRDSCRAQCILQGQQSGVIHFNGGGRFNLGYHCECTQ